MKIQLFSDDILLIERWKEILKEDVHVVEDIDALLELEDKLIILNFNSCKNILYKIVEKNKVLVLHRTPNINTAKIVLGYGAKGYGNALMKGHFVISAIQTIREELIWLYPEFITLLVKEIPYTNNDKSSKLDGLTKREQEVAILLSEAFTYQNISEKLNITSRTVKAHAIHIYSKLGVKDKLGLALYLK